MNKPVLGRGLVNLMEGSKVVGQSDSASPPAEFSHGLGNFLRGEAAASDPVADSARVFSAMLRRRLRWSLLMADVLLVSLVAWLLWAKPLALGWAGTLLCLAAVALGAWLAWLAFSLPDGDSSN